MQTHYSDNNWTRFLTEATQYYVVSFHTIHNHMSHLMLQVVVAIRPLPRQLESLQMDTTSSSSSSYRQHSNSLVLSRGDNPKDKSGLLDVKKGMYKAALEYCDLIG